MGYKGIVIVSGVGLREAKKRFKTPDPAEIVNKDGKMCKLNSPAGVSIELSKAGYLVYMIGDCSYCLEYIGSNFMANEYHYKKIDMLDRYQVEQVVKRSPN